MQGAKKTTKGRRKIAITKIENRSRRQVTFCKRRTGLFKKAAELCVLTGAQITILVKSPGNRVFAYGHPNVDSAIERYLAGTATASDHYAGITGEPEAEKMQGAMTEGSKAVVEGGFWWEKPIVELGLKELELYNADSVIERFYAGTPTAIDHYAGVSGEVEVEKMQSAITDGSKAVDDGGFWWEKPIGDLGLEELELYSADSVIERFPTGATTATDHYAGITGELKAEKMQGAMTEGSKEVDDGGFWWEKPIDELGLEELELYMAALKELKENLKIRAQELTGMELY